MATIDHANRNLSTMPIANSSLRALILEALSSQPYFAHTPAGFTEPTAYAAKPTAVSAILRLDDDELPALFDKDGRLIHDPAAHIVATTIKLSGALIASSRVAQAGAHIIIRPEKSDPVPTGHLGEIAFRRDIEAFRIIESAVFSTPTDDVDVSISSLPVSAARLDWSTSISKAVRFEIPRAERREKGDEKLVAEVMAALILGLSRAADEVLLSAIAGESPATFSLAAAAARGLKFHELNALIGTAGDAASIDEDGTLRAAGIGAEFTPDAMGTIIGSFGRAAVAIHPEVLIHMDRTAGKRDTLSITAWAQLIPCVPDATAFWVGA